MALVASTSRRWRYNVFLSFHGPDVRKAFLSHLRKQLEHNGIITFNDEGIERSQTIGPQLIEAIQESRISIVVLSLKYASSSWCLDELVEILKCKESVGQIVMTIFYKVNPTDVRKQIGEFGETFKETCIGKTETEIQSWTKALTHVANIAGEHSMNWVNEAKKIEEIARDVSNKLNATPSSDFDGMVGLEAHLEKIRSLLNLENDRAMIVGISGPAGIGKTTIARALYNQLSCDFSLRYFMENVRGSYRRTECDEHGLKLRLQETLLSNILDQNGIKIRHLNVVNERLCNQKVLIILDDVDHLEQLDALARDIYWFGPGSRIIVTTEDHELLQQHGISNTYQVDFPSNEEALAIFCQFTFRQIFPLDGFAQLAERAVQLCSNLPLGLRVVGSSLRGKKEDEWEVVLQRLETSLDRDIERILRLGYENLNEKDQSLFLYIAILFNYTNTDHLRAMLADMDERHGLKTLVDKSLIRISNDGEILMHKLLQQVGIQAIRRQEPWKRHILIDAHDICGVLEDDKGTRTMTGISFDISEISEVCVSKRAFKSMRNLQFLSIHTKRFGIDGRVHIPEEVEFPPRLRLLHWELYPRKSLPSSFNPEHLVELNLQDNQLEKLWEGTQPLTNLKKMTLAGSWRLKELPDLTNATNLEELDLSFCERLVEISSSFLHLHKLIKLRMVKSMNLEFTSGPEEVPIIVNFCSRVEYRYIRGNGKLKGLTHLPPSITELNLSHSVFQKIPDCIKALSGLQSLCLSGCYNLESLPELPPSLTSLLANDCESLMTVVCPFNTPNAHLDFTNCFQLRRQARRAIIQHSFRHGSALLPGSKLPAKFRYQAKGNSLTIFPNGNPYSWLVVCVVIAPNEQTNEYSFSRLLCRRIGQGDLICSGAVSYFQTEHLFIFTSGLPCIEPSEVSTGITLEFSSTLHDFDIIECGAMIMAYRADGSNNGGSDDEDCSNNYQDTSSESSEASDKECDDSTVDQISECGANILTYETDGSNIDISDDVDCGSNYHDSYESNNKDYDDSIADQRCEYGAKFLTCETVGRKNCEPDHEDCGNNHQSSYETSYREDNEDDGYKSGSGEASKDNDEDMVDGDYESISRKRPRKKTNTTNLNLGKRPKTNV